MPDKQKKTIMVVEDDSFVVDIYKTKLSQEGFDVLIANNGIEAIKILSDGARPDLILLDIVMPYKDGLEVLEEIKKDKRFKKIPIILLTNLSQKEEIERGFQLGACGYLIKSHFTPSEVMEKINEQLNK